MDASAATRIPDVAACIPTIECTAIYVPAEWHATDEQLSTRAWTIRCAHRENVVIVV